MPCDGGDHAFGRFRARQRFQDLRFGQQRIGQRGGYRLRVAFRENRADHSRWAALGEREFLADGKLRNFRDQRFLGETADFGLRGSGQREANEIEGEQLAHQRHGHVARRMRMRGQCETNRFGSEPFRLQRDGFDYVGGDIEALEQNADVSFVEKRIFDQREKHGFVLLVNQQRDFLLRSCPRDIGTLEPVEGSVGIGGASSRGPGHLRSGFGR